MQGGVGHIWGALIALSLGAGAACGEGPADFKPFVREAYKEADFNVTAHTYSHGRVKIKITQAQRTVPHEKEPPYSCRAWLEIAEKDGTVWQRSYDDIAPAGFSYGLFVPQKQPAPRFFAVVKVGDNDGRLFLVDRETGTVFDLPGGLYFVTTDNRYLVSEYVGETQDIVVFDLVAGKVVLDSKTTENARLPGEIYDWYYDGRRYFFTIVRGEEKSRGAIVEDRSVMYEVTMRRPGIAPVTPDFKRVFHKSWDFDPRSFKDCNSDTGKQNEEHEKGAQDSGTDPSK